MSVNPNEFRITLGYFASGVTIITTHYTGNFHGTTASSFCSLSLHPPLILVCIEKNSASHSLISKSAIFGVNVLAQNSEWISHQFARKDSARFSKIAHRIGTLGVPLLEDAIATLECRVVAQYPGGDHSIFVGVVETTSYVSEGQPLLYFRSGYNQLHNKFPNKRI